jgi:dynein heavy chain 1
LDVPLVLFDQVLDHILRIDWIFRQPQGHLLLIGVSGAGKTTVLRFFAWMNGLSVFQVRTRAISRSFIFSILLGQLINQYNSW